MKKIIVFMLLFIGGIINSEEVFAGAKQNFKISLRVVEPKIVELGSIENGQEINEVRKNQFNIKALKGSNVEISLREGNTTLEDRAGNEIEVEGTVRVDGRGKTRSLGADRGMSGAIDLKVAERTLDSTLFEGEYAGEIVVDVNYN